MTRPVSRRSALTQLGMTGAAAAFAWTVLRGEPDPILIAGTPVEIVIAAVSEWTARLVVRPLRGASYADVSNDGALVEAAVGRVRGRHDTEFAPVRAGDLTIRLTRNPPTLHVDAGRRSIQRSPSRAPRRSFLG